MPWVVRFDDAFEPEFDQLTPGVQAELLARARVLEQFGPQLGRPHVDTLTGSKYPNMKELRFHCEDGLWRVAFAFDPKREGILLAAGNKAGANQERFYEQLIGIADGRFAAHLEAVREARAKAKAEKDKKK